jgi:predicted ester cyclase
MQRSVSRDPDVERNRRTVHRVFEEAVNRGDFSVLDDSWSPRMVNHGGGADREAIRAWLTDNRATFPDLHATIEAIIAEGDLVATRERWSATHLPSGRRVGGTIYHWFRFDGGLVVEEWSEGWSWLAGLSAVGATAVGTGRVFDVNGNIVPTSITRPRLETP